MTTVPFGKANTAYNRDEVRVSKEVFDLYLFLHAHTTMAPNRKKDVLRASVASTEFGFWFDGLVSVRTACLIDTRIRENHRQDLCAGLHRDHFYTWKETSEFFFSQSLMNSHEFWEEMKRRNEIALILKEEHEKVSSFQRANHGLQSYSRAGIELARIDRRAVRIRGYGCAVDLQHWPSAEGRQAFTFTSSESAMPNPSLQPTSSDRG